MRTSRLLGEGRSFYHVFSRVVDRQMVFQNAEKEFFRKTMRNLEAFSGVRVVTYCLMSNHFHLLLDVPDREELEPLSEEELLAVLPLLYDEATVSDIAKELKSARESGDESRRQQILQRFENRRGNLSQFIKDLKQRVTAFINNRLERTGTLWEGRYKSVLVEGNETTLITMGAYIDLNPVRAGMVKNPEDYRYSGYAEAMSASRNAGRARAGLGILLSESLQDADFKSNWEETQKRYRVFLYEEGREQVGDEAGRVRGRRGFSEAEVEKVLAEGGNIPIPTLLRHQVRYFCDGVVIGTAGFVESIFQREQQRSRRFGKNRKTGARKMRGADWGEIRVLRDLRKDVITLPRR